MHMSIGHSWEDNSALQAEELAVVRKNSGPCWTQGQKLARATGSRQCTLAAVGSCCQSFDCGNDKTRVRLSETPDPARDLGGGACYRQLMRRMMYWTRKTDSRWNQCSRTQPEVTSRPKASLSGAERPAQTNVG